MMTKKNFSIELYRIIFALLVVLFHTRQFLPLGGFFDHGNIGVSFFFILSGRFMAAQVNKNNIPNDRIGIESFNYTLKKMSTFFLPFLICWVCSFFYLNMEESVRGINWLIRFVASFGEIIQIRMVGVESPSYMFHCWYLSAMILAIAVCYPVMLKMKSNYNYTVAPIVGFFVLGYIIIRTGMFSLVTEIQEGGFFTKGFLWAVAAMNLGVFSYGIECKLKDVKFTGFGKFVISFTGFIAFVLTILYSIVQQPNNFDFMATIFLTYGVMTKFLVKSFVDTLLDKIGIICNFLGKASLYIYLVHVTVLRACMYHPKYFTGKNVVQQELIALGFILIGTVVLYGLTWIFRKINKQLSKIMFKVKI